MNSDRSRPTWWFAVAAAATAGAVVRRLRLARPSSAATAVEPERNAEVRARAIFDASGEAIFVLDALARIAELNAAARDAFAREGVDLVGESFERVVAGDAILAARESVAYVLGGNRARFDLVLIDRTGARLDAACSATPLGAGDGLAVTVRDVTTQRRLERQNAEFAQRVEALYGVASGRRASEEQIASALQLGARELCLENAFLGAFEGDALRVVATAGNSEIPLDTLIPFARHEFDAVASDPTAPAYAAVADALTATLSATYDRRWKRTFAMPVEVEGERYGALVFGSFRRAGAAVVRHDRSYVRLMAALVGAAIERARTRERLDALAYFDALTGLPNRQMLRDRLAAAVRHSAHAGAKFAVHYLDLDGFKAINDAFGHGEGDEVLRAVARRLTTALGKDDTFARLGGDEFVLVQNDVTDPAQAAALARRILRLMDEPYRVDAREHRVGVSIGIGCYPQHGTAAPALLASADEALYYVKRNGKNNFAFYASVPAITTHRAT